MKYFAVLLILTCSALAVWFFTQASAEGDFHPPSTEAEKRLESILRFYEADDYNADNLLDRGEGGEAVPADKRVDYSSMLTRKLVASWIEEERKLVAEQCGGRYIPGELCGMEASPLTCAQDYNPEYFYKTIKADDHSAIIEYKWAPSDNVAARYGLVKEQGIWKINTVECRP